MLQRVSIIMLYFCSFVVMASDTVLKLYRPYGEAVDQAPLTVKNELSGYCFAQSQLNVREDAWRCQAQGTIYDPCFVHSGRKKTEVICPQSPWVGESVRILVAEPLNNQGHKTLDMSRALPWAIELVNGERCQALETKEQFDGMPVRYRCSGENLLVGYLQRCRNEWSMLEKTPTGVNTVALKRAWF